MASALTQKQADVVETFPAQLPGLRTQGRPIPGVVRAGGDTSPEFSPANPGGHTIA